MQLPQRHSPKHGRPPQPNANTTNMNEMARPSEDLSNKREEELMASWVGHQANCPQKLATVLEGTNNTDQSELPLVLRHVVLLWEETQQQLFEGRGATNVQPCPILPLKSRKPESKARERNEKDKKHKHKKKGPQNDGNEEPQQGGGGGGDGIFNCELCGMLLLPQSFQHHFFLYHPGCRSSSHGCGYVLGQWRLLANNDHFDQLCGTVANGCYHMCWNCRRRYKNTKKGDVKKDLKDGSSRKK